MLKQALLVAEVVAVQPLEHVQALPREIAATLAQEAQGIATVCWGPMHATLGHVHGTGLNSF